MHQVVRAALQQFGADPRQRLQRMRTPLMMAASSGCASLAKLLLDAGADPNAKDCEGTTPLLVRIAERALAVPPDWTHRAGAHNTWGTASVKQVD